MYVPLSYSLNTLCTASQKQKARACTSTGPSLSTLASGPSSTSQQGPTFGTGSIGQAATQPQSDSSRVQTSNGQGNPVQKWQQQTLSNHINGVESRIVRGQLLVRQPWTTRMGPASIAEYRLGRYLFHVRHQQPVVDPWNRCFHWGGSSRRSEFLARCNDWTDERNQRRWISSQQSDPQAEFQHRCRLFSHRPVSPA